MGVDAKQNHNPYRPPLIDTFAYGPILFFGKGKIVEDAIHSELLGKAELYKSLWDA